MRDRRPGRRGTPVAAALVLVLGGGIATAVVRGDGTAHSHPASGDAVAQSTGLPGAPDPSAVRELIVAGSTTGSTTYRMTGTLTYDEPGGRLPATSITVEHGRTAMQVQASVPHVWDETLRVIGSKSYLQASALTLPAGAHWAAVSTAVAHSVAAVPDTVGSLDQLLSSDGQAPNRVGTEVISGVGTTHYVVPILADGQGFAPSAASPTSALCDVWIDAGDRIRRLEFTVSNPPGQKVTREMERFDFADFGATFTVIRPTPSDTVPYAEATWLPGTGPQA